VLVVDAANVVGSRPNGWWRDRAKAAADLCGNLAGAVASDRLTPPVVVVLEGQARRGVSEGDDNGVRVVHATGSGDDAIVDLAAEAAATGDTVTVVTADRGLRDRAQRAGCEVVGPRWLLDRIEE
jgi:hypothetical protein